MTGVVGAHSPEPQPKTKIQKMRECIILLTSTLGLILIHVPIAGMYGKIHWAGI